MRRREPSARRRIFQGAGPAALGELALRQTAYEVDARQSSEVREADQSLPMASRSSLSQTIPFRAPLLGQTKPQLAIRGSREIG
jgi:hypothetical protein